MNNLNNIDITKLKKEMLADLDPQAKKEYGPLMGLSSTDTENYIKARS